MQEGKVKARTGWFQHHFPPTRAWAIPQGSIHTTNTPSSPQSMERLRNIPQGGGNSAQPHHQGLGTSPEGLDKYWHFLLKFLKALPRIGIPKVHSLCSGKVRAGVWKREKSWEGRMGMRPQLLQVQNNSKISQGNRALNLDPNLSKAGYYGKTSRRRCTRSTLGQGTTKMCLVEGAWPKLLLKSLSWFPGSPTERSPKIRVVRVCWWRMPGFWGAIRDSPSQRPQ